MDYSNRDRIPAELEEVAARLRQERATATPFELDRIKLQAMRQAERPRPSFYTRQKGMLLKSRLALILVVAAGFTLSTTGATLAITGSSGSGNAAVSEYGAQGVSGANEGGGESNGKSEGGVKGKSESGGETNGQSEGGVNDKSLGGGDSTEPVSQTSGGEQVAVAGDSGSLPFTGFLAIPLLIVGVVLLSFGAIMYRKTSGRYSAGT